MRKIICSLLVALSSATAYAQSAPPAIAGDAPDRHVVKPGDTLWGIAGLFLKEPWRWPEVWRLNREQIRNPHLIYPGQIVYLEDFNGSPRLRVGQPVRLSPQTYEEPVKEPIASIPHKAIEPFLAKPIAVEAGFNETAPRIVGTEEGRVYLSSGDIAYVSGVTGKNSLWNVYRPAAPIRDPETKQIIGYEAEYLGDVKLVREGEPATFQVVSAQYEIGKGDRLVAARPAELLAYAPRAPEREIEGSVARIVGGVASSGRHSVVLLNRGANDGVEVGHVFAAYLAGSQVDIREEQQVDRYTLPDERSGLVFVFRVYDSISYALVMDARRPITVGDRFRKP
ncbi:LysM peptidoglycan-binding domain-containing protein [Methyloversatilis sp.]|uniref:LysM peptidoglycan-binding domain-containing protein n=1 Tax=Methyloversatilis sp. TaxID=2569862 RepID=UPI0035B28CB7